MLGDSLPSHGQPSAEFAERLTIFRMQPIEQMPAVRVGQSSKDSVIIHPRDMQPFGSLSRYYAIERLRVKPTEKILETEMSGWVQRMQNALAQPIFECGLIVCR
jgi:hypothetical protein